MKKARREFSPTGLLLILMQYKIKSYSQKPVCKIQRPKNIFLHNPFYHPLLYPYKKVSTSRHLTNSIPIIFSDNNFTFLSFEFIV